MTNLLTRVRIWLRKPKHVVMVVVVALALAGGSWAYIATRPTISCSSNLLDTKASMTTAECEALAAFYEPNVQYKRSRDEEARDFVPRVLRNWTTESNPCFWTGVQCAGGHVTELTLENLVNYGPSVIPPEVGQLTHLIRFRFQAKYFNGVPEELGALTNLRSLSLEGDVDFSNPEALNATIRRLANLEDLSLLLHEFDQPILKEVPDVLSDLPHLTRLQLTSDKEIPPKVLGLTKLTSLRFVGPTIVSERDRTEITQIPASIENLTQLTELTVSGAGLASLPPGIGRLKRLTSLDLSGNKFTEYPAELSRLPRLQRLSLADNKLGTLSARIARLTALEALDLTNAELTDLPQELGQMPNLTDLALGENPKLGSKALEVVYAVNPVKLDLHSGWIRSFPVAEGQLSALTDLNLRDNLFDTFPADLVRLPNLKRLDFAENQLKILPSDLSRLAQLEHLDLSENNFHDVDGLVAFTNRPGYEHRLNLDETCASSTNPRLQKLIDDRGWKQTARC